MAAAAADLAAISDAAISCCLAAPATLGSITPLEEPAMAAMVFPAAHLGKAWSSMDIM